MKWTTDIPTKPGWYWIDASPVTKQPFIGKLAVPPVAVRQYVWDTPCLWIGSDTYPVVLVKRWSGPLTPPEDDEDAKDTKAECTNEQALNDALEWGTEDF